MSEEALPAGGEYAGALERLDMARIAMDYLSPCQARPEDWDQRHERSVINEQGEEVILLEYTSAHKRRMSRARNGCLSCQVFDACQELVLTINLVKPETTGMVAGIAVAPPSKNRARR